MAIDIGRRRFISTVGRAATAWRKLAIGCIAFASLAIVACSPKTAQNDAEQTCALKLYPDYDQTRLDQCMAVCKSCRSGTIVTCSTSCKLKGAN
jgi:hypothetical protein